MRVLFATGAALVLLGCTSDPATTPIPTPASLTAEAAATGTPGWLLDEPLRVTVRDARGLPVEDATVQWSTTVAGAWLGAPSSTTNADGVAEVTFAPGAATGTQAVRASAGVATVDVVVPVAAFAATAVATANAAGGIRNAACALDGDGVLWCWRHSIDAAVDPSVSPPRAIPASARPVQAAGGRSYRLIAGSGAGDGFSEGRFCAVAVDDGLWCWSPQDTAVDGRAVPANVATPGRFVAVAVVSTPASAVIASDDAEHTVCGLDAGGAIWCRGGNVFGEAGAGIAGPVDDFAPVVAGGSFATLRGGENGFCATDSAGLAWCWGNNQGGRLVAGGDAILNRPIRMGGDAPYLTVAPLLWGACGLRPDASLHCWGRTEVKYVGGSLSVLPDGAAAAAVASGSPVEAFVGGGFSFAILRRTDGQLRVVGHFNHSATNPNLVREPIPHPAVTGSVGVLLPSTGDFWCFNPTALRCAYQLEVPRGVPAP